MNLSKVILLATLALGCTKSKTLTIKNTLTKKRTELIAISNQDLLRAGFENMDQLEIVDTKGEALLTQITHDSVLLIPVVIEGKSKKTYQMKEVKAPEKTPLPEAQTFSRFVPERIDDYAWENDKVAFRTFGPKAQRMAENGEPGGTLTSGIDCWLKRVPYPIINKWYEKPAKGQSYHEDDGEGLDNYHVGISRGCGGIGIIVGDSLYTSGNFESWKRHDVGPLQTKFTLDYGKWQAGNLLVKEEKTISLDIGSYLTKVEVTFTGTLPENATIGLAIHDKEAVTTANRQDGWFSLWSPHHGEKLGTGIVMDPMYNPQSEVYLSEIKDTSHFRIHLTPINGKFVYYTGFGWSKGGKFTTQTAWENYLSEFALNLKNPLTVTIR